MNRFTNLLPYYYKTAIAFYLIYKKQIMPRSFKKGDNRLLLAKVKGYYIISLPAVVEATMIGKTFLTKKDFGGLVYAGKPS